MVVEIEHFFMGGLKKGGQKNLHQNGGAHFFSKKLRKVSRFGFFSIFSGGAPGAGAVRTPRATSDVVGDVWCAQELASA